MVTITLPSTLTKLVVIFTNKPAPRPNGNLWIDIDINLSKLTALFHCLEEESVGTDKGRKVIFRADHDCLLKFSNLAVFNLESVQLTAYKERELTVRDETKNASTFLDVYVGTGIVSAAESLSEVVTVKGGPHIVVP